MDSVDEAATLPTFPPWPLPLPPQVLRLMTMLRGIGNVVDHISNFVEILVQLPALRELAAKVGDSSSSSPSPHHQKSPSHNYHQPPPPPEKTTAHRKVKHFL